ncbi:FmdB family zinc ribbon protein [Staphylococcus pettenkoferi]|uniref:FmdB family zinc ribbon protein n=1 Tax=Staphylococcus pettenkoferi TaxID=170573 RepID=UPI002DD43A92|nr:zinc ribbon domain-containing protein [Staphylococcus pettenkoferi]
MPNYTYECPDCAEFTIRQSMNANHDEAECPKCGQRSTRVFSAPQTGRMDSKLKKRIGATSGKRQRLAETTEETE